jgi:hypothetical protein
VASRTKRRPYNPALAEYQRAQQAAEDAKKRDRKSQDLLRNARVAAMEVDDPISGDKIVVLRSIRSDPLGNLHAKKYIREDQYQAGREYQNYFELAQGHQQACDPSQPYVDQSFRHRGVSVTQSAALMRLNAANRELGQNGSALVMDVLITGLSISQVGEKRGVGGEIELKYLGKRFREALDTLALVYGFAMPGTDTR